MNEEIQPEIWQVEVAGTIYEAHFDELKEWVYEGSLQPEDKVRRANLRWIEAKRVPALVPFFNAKATDSKNNLHINTVGTEQPAQPVHTENVQVSSINVNHEEVPAPVHKTHPSSQIKHEIPNVCFRHADATAVYRCDGCGNGYCKSCPSSYGGSVRICPDCGQMCRDLAEEMKTRSAKASVVGINGGFGFNDLVNSFSYPFRFKSSLVLGAFMYMIFTVGQLSRGIGGIILGAAALICWMMANTLTFGVLANTIGNFTQGKFDSDFMPSFDDFSIWDDVVHPCFLSIGAYLVSFGPFILTIAIAFYLVMSSVTDQMRNFQSDLENIPGTPYYSAREVDDQSTEVNKIIAENTKKSVDNVDDLTRSAEMEAATTGKDQETIAQEKLWEDIQQSRKEQFESIAGKSDQQIEMEYRAMVGAVLKLSAPLVIVGLVTFLWGLFFFPAACMVAGYTRSFFATVNPLVGLDTIRRLGADYVKALFMLVLLVVIIGVISMLVAAVLYPFDMPRVGNLPATAISAVFGFYFSVVFACMLGFLLYKASDRLKLSR